eukprot:scaffold101026_cov18-Prasinocladus_malaysianus.AAC.1
MSRLNTVRDRTGSRFFSSLCDRVCLAYGYPYPGVVGPADERRRHQKVRDRVRMLKGHLRVPVTEPCTYLQLSTILIRYRTSTT